MNEYRMQAIQIASEWFWEMIAASKADPAALDAILFAMTRDEMIWFHDQFVTATAELKSLPGFEERFASDSEDFMDDVAESIVSSGLDAYAAALELLPPSNYEPNEARMLGGRAPAIFRQRYGELLDAY
jgi:hypothetical protein